MSECELSNLIAELEKAEAGSRGLDMRIWRLDHAYVRFSTAWERESAPGHYTTSIDAALPGENIECVIKGNDTWLASHREKGNIYAGTAKTEALARRIAALKARQAND